MSTHSKQRQPVMIGIHVPKRPNARAKAVRLYPSAREFNAAYDAWVVRTGRTQLVYQRPT
jgi:hypothetical protein